MKLYKKISAIVCVVILFAACEDFLSENPSKTSSLVPTTTEHLENLLNDYNSFYQEFNDNSTYGTDDFGLIKEIYDARASVYPLSQVQYATWDKEYIPNNEGRYWNSEFKKIFTANMVLSYIGEVSGDEITKKALEAEAHFIRAYSYYQLVNTYCLPYSEANKSEMGLPLKASTSFEESEERASLEETWAFIEADLLKALELDVKLEMVDNKLLTWRASTSAVKAFAARYYLSLNDYANAQKYAEEAMAAHFELVDYNTDMRYSDQLNEINVNGETVTLLYPYTHDKQGDPSDMMEWKELYYFRFLDNSQWWNIPSSELLGLYDQTNDLRYKYHIVEDYSYDRGMFDPAYSYPGYVFFYKQWIPSGPTVAEMLLIKAESQIRQGGWAEGLATANELRAVRMDNSASADVINLSAASKNEALVKVLNERRREMPFTTRWSDLRRYNNNSESVDDVILTKSFYPYNGSTILDSENPITYTLEKNSRRYAVPLPNIDIQTTQGVLKQNIY